MAHRRLGHLLVRGDGLARRYYAAGAVVGALVWDLAGSRLRFPWWTAGAALSLFTSRSVPLPAAVHGWITLAYCLATVFLLVPRDLLDYGRTRPGLGDRVRAAAFRPPEARAVRRR